MSVRTKNNTVLLTNKNQISEIGKKSEISKILCLVHWDQWQSHHNEQRTNDVNAMNVLHLPTLAKKTKFKSVRQKCQNSVNASMSKYNLWNDNRYCRHSMYWFTQTVYVPWDYTPIPLQLYYTVFCRSAIHANAPIVRITR